MGFNKKDTPCEDATPNQTLCQQVKSSVGVECLKDVNFGILEDGDQICYNKDAEVWTNVPKLADPADVLSSLQSQIDALAAMTDNAINTLSLSGTILTATDSDGNSLPVDLSSLIAGLGPEDVINNLSINDDEVTITTALGATFVANITDDNTTNAGLSVSGGNLVLTDSDGNSVQVLATDIDSDTTYVYTVSPNGGTSAQAFDDSGNPVGPPQVFGSDDQTAFEVGFDPSLTDNITAVDVQGAIVQLDADCTAKNLRLDALEALNPVVGTQVIAETSDILVTYLDGTTETLDLPEFSAATGADGLITFDLNGTPFGPFDTGAHAVDTDTDTFSSPVENPDGTVTVTYANGATHTYTPNGPAVDTNTTYSFVTNADGSVTITGSDGSVFTGPPSTIDTDTDTFSTLSGQTITFANGDTLTVPSATAFNDFQGNVIDPATDEILTRDNVTPAPSCETPVLLWGENAAGEVKTYEADEVSTKQIDYDRVSVAAVNISAANLEAAFGTVITSVTKNITNTHSCKTLRVVVYAGGWSRFRIGGGTSNDWSFNFENTSTAGAGFWTHTDGLAINKLRSNGNAGNIEVGSPFHFTYVSEPIAPSATITVGYDIRLNLGSGAAVPFQANNGNFAQISAQNLITGIGVYEDVI